MGIYKPEFQHTMEQLGWTYNEASKDLRQQWHKSTGRRNGGLGQDSEEWRNDALIALTVCEMRREPNP